MLPFLFKKTISTPTLSNQHFCKEVRFVRLSKLQLSFLFNETEKKNIGTANSEKRKGTSRKEPMVATA